MPRVPPAPPRFSTMIDWPSSTPRGSKSARGTISVALPAANGMNARIGLDGQGWASAAFEPRAITAAMIAGYQQDFMSWGPFIDLATVQQAGGQAAPR